MDQPAIHRARLECTYWNIQFKIAWLCKIQTIWTPVVFLHYSDIYMVRFPNPLAFGLPKVSRGPCLHLRNFVNVIIDMRHFVEHFNGLQVAFINTIA